MRILYFTRDYTSHDHRFLSALAESGNSIFFLRMEKRGEQREDRVLPAGVQQLHWQGGNEPVERQQYRKLSRELRSLISEIQPDVIHAGSIQTAALIAAMAGARPLASMSWGYDMLKDARSSHLMERDTRFTLRLSDSVICDCDIVRNEIKSFGVPDDQIVQFPWGVDLDQFRPESRKKARSKLNWQDDQFIVLCTRAWEPIYDVVTIVKGFISAASSNPNLFLVLLGGGPQQAELRQLVTSAGMEGRIDMSGSTRYKDLPRYYRGADLYVSGSLVDGSSVSLMESLASGTPALLSDIPSNREWVREGVEGWFYPVGDGEKFAEKLLDISHNSQCLPEMREQCRMRAEEKADWSKNFPQLLNAYQIAIERWKHK